MRDNSSVEGRVPDTFRSSVPDHPPVEPIPPELFLERYSPGIRRAVERLRAVVRRAVPDAIERVRPGWGLIGYDVPVAKGL